MALPTNSDRIWPPGFPSDFHRGHSHDSKSFIQKFRPFHTNLVSIIQDISPVKNQVNTRTGQASTSAQALSQGASRLINRSIQDIEAGTEPASLAISAMQVLTDCIQSIKSLMDVVAASVQQSEMVIPAESGIQGISAVVQPNSTAAEKGAAMSKKLSTQSRMPNGLIGPFHIS